MKPYHVEVRPVGSLSRLFLVSVGVWVLLLLGVMA
jgi:hypothetical protein